MFKLIIYCTGRPMIHGFKRREFTWSAEHDCHVYRGKEYTPEEFNAVVVKALRDNADMHPLVKVVIPAPVAVKEPTTKAPAVTKAKPAMAVMEL